MRLNLKNEKTLIAWLWRVLLGPAMLFDGLVSTVTVGTLRANIALDVSRRLAKARFATTQEPSA